MRFGFFAEQRTAALPVGLLVIARIANMTLGLAVIPVLIHYLGGNGFAAWALLLAISAAFTLLELGMALTYVKQVAPLIQHDDWLQVNAVLNNSFMLPSACSPRITPSIVACRKTSLAPVAASIGGPSFASNWGALRKTVPMAAAMEPFRPVYRLTFAASAIN